MIGYLGAFVVGVAIRFVATFPISIYGLATISLRLCDLDQLMLCLGLWPMAPLVYYSGPLGSNYEEEPQSPWPTITLAAVILATIWTIVALVRRHRADKRSS